MHVYIGGYAQLACGLVTNITESQLNSTTLLTGPWWARASKREREREDWGRIVERGDGKSEREERESGRVRGRTVPNWIRGCWVQVGPLSHDQPPVALGFHPSSHCLATPHRLLTTRGFFQTSAWWGGGCCGWVLRLSVCVPGFRVALTALTIPLQVI